MCPAALVAKLTRAPQGEIDKAGTHNNNTNMPDHFRSRINKAADKRVSEVLKIKYIVNSVSF